MVVENYDKEVRNVQDTEGMEDFPPVYGGLAKFSGTLAENSC